MDMRKDKQVLPRVRFFFHKKIGSETKRSVLAQELHKPVIQKFKRKKFISGLKIISGQ